MPRKVEEKVIITSASPSRYQTGTVRYIGGQTKTARLFRSRQNEKTFSKKLGKTVLSLAETEVIEEALVMKLVTQATTHASASFLTASRVVGKVDSFPQERT